MLQTYRIPYGEGYQSVILDDRQVVGCLERKKYIPDRSQESIVLAALQHSVGSPRLSVLCQNIHRLLLITNDLTRPMPSRITVPLLIEEARALNRDLEITIIIASGLHRAMTGEELVEKLGADIVNNYRIVVHVARDENSLTSLGTLKSGNELWVNREIASHDLVIAEGFIEPHWLAGFSGGRKSIIPGVAGWKTIMNNHSAHNVDHPRCRAGILTGNPAHEEFTEAAMMAGLKFILNVTLDEHKRITNAFAGETIAAHGQGCEFVRQYAEVTATPADIVITSNGGYPLDLNFYQSVKGLDTASKVVKKDGIIIICTECREGVGQRNFYDIFKKYGDPELILRKMHAKEIEIVDQWSAQIIARIITRCRVFVVSSCLDAEDMAQMGMGLFTDLQAAISEALSIKGDQASICLIPEGPLVLPVSVLS